jgi:hypothetical protein
MEVKGTTTSEISMEKVMKYVTDVTIILQVGNIVIRPK